MRSSSADRPPIVREEAAIAQPGNSPSGASSASRPGASYTPTGDQVSGQFPRPPRSSDDLVKYKFTLADLSERSYYLIHEADAATQPHQLAELRRHLSAAVLLANLEVCIIRSWQETKKTRNPGPPPPLSVNLDLAEQEPLKKVLPRAEWLQRTTTRDDITDELEQQISLAKKALATAELKQAISDSNVEELKELAFLFAAYQPAVLDDDIKSSLSPYDARSHTGTIEAVREQVETNAADMEVTAPGELADLAKEVWKTVWNAKPELRSTGSTESTGSCSFGMCLLKSAFMSGHSELVEQLLPKLKKKEAINGKNEVIIIGEQEDIIGCLTRSWQGYRWGKVLQKSLRSGARRNQTTDWLDFGGGYPRAVLIAHRVIETIIGRGDRQGGTQSGGVTNGASAEATVQAAESASASQLRSLTESKEAELSKLERLFRQSTACKLLAIAILHVVVERKKDINKLWRERAVGAAQEGAAQEGAAQAGEDGSVDRELPPPAESRRNFRQADDQDDKIDERAQHEEEERSRRYCKLHTLAVQACHLAVHAGSLSTVADAIKCIKAVRAWPAINLEMLNDLAKHFPQECCALLKAVPLKVVKMEDNVLPFNVPPGFITVAVSNKDVAEFGQSGVSGSTQDAEHFAAQTEEDVSIETSLLVSGRAWLALLFLFWPSDLRNPTSRKLLRVAKCALSAFLWQGPGSIAVAVLFMVLLAVLGLASRLVAAVFRIVWCGILARVWKRVVRRFPRKGKVTRRIQANQIHPAAASAAAAAAAAPAGNSAGGGDRAGGDGDVDAGGDGSEEGRQALKANLGRGLWQEFVAYGHTAVIDGALGWGQGSASISCRKVPIAMPYAPEPSPRQLDTSLLEKLLWAPDVHRSVFGSKVVRALILFKWNFFTKYFIILQFLLHITYMGIFLAYAFTIKDMEPVDGRENGLGAGTPGCQLQEPTTTQIALLMALAVMTVDFTIQEVRQIWHFGLVYFTQAWDVLDVCSVVLVVASIALHFSCTSGVSPLTLRGLASVQILLLFMRLLYYAMASDKLGSFVRMVLETTYDLMMFFGFLSVVFVGFALAIIISQGSLADEEQTFIKLFTMMYGDFDVNFLSTLDSGALGLNALTRMLASLYMIIVTIILLNLLISVISESYERIRANERWESLRNKALLVVESETQLYAPFLTWLYSTLTAPAPNSRATDQDGKKYLYVITPEYARRAVRDDEEEDDSDEEDDEEEGEDDGQWNGRLGEMKRHITAQGRDVVREVKKAIHPAATAGFKVGVGASADATVGLDERAVQVITKKVEAVVTDITEKVEAVVADVRQEIQKLREELQLRVGQAPMSQGRNPRGQLPAISGSGDATRSRPEAGSAPPERSAATAVGDSAKRAPLRPQGSA